MIDITFDLETCATCPTAAVMSIGAVAWNEMAKIPLSLMKGIRYYSPAFSEYIDLRGMFINL